MQTAVLCQWCTIWPTTDHFAFGWIESKKVELDKILNPVVLYDQVGQGVTEGCGISTGLKAIMYGQHP